MVRLRLRRAKSDLFGKGVWIYLGQTGSPLCPVAAILHYLSVCPRSQGPLFVWRDGTPLTRDQLVREVKKALRASGLDDSCYSGHSFRIGTATAAAAAGVPADLIKMLGRWESNAYQLYVRTPRETLASISTLIA